MVEASSFFIIFEFLWRAFSSVNVSYFGAYAGFVWGGLFLLMIAFGTLLRHATGRTAQVSYALSVVMGIASFILFLVSLFELMHGAFENWTLTTFGWQATQTYTYLSLFFLLTTGIIALIATRFTSREARRNSTLSGHQLAWVYAVFALIACIGIGLWAWAPPFFSITVIIVLFTVEILSLLYWFYDIVVYLISRIIPRKPRAAVEPTPGKMNHFAILVCAHNEEQVIEHLLASLRSMDYPRDKYDVFVICDNCRDETASIAKEGGALVLKRDDLSRRGKNEALQWALNTILENPEQENLYDALVVLNADNLVNQGYLGEINEHLNHGHEIMQTYLGCKNPDDSWVAKCSSIGFWLGNTDYQEARSRLNLSSQMRGTGMVLRPSILKELSWKADSLTEELAFTSEYLLRKNRSCHWVHTARFYDERPITLKASLKQRTRWMQGHARTMIEYAPKLFASSLRKRSLRQFDMAVYLTKPLFILISLMVYGLRLIFASVFPESIATTTLIMSLPLAGALAAIWFLVNIYTLSTEHRGREVAWLVPYYVFTCTWCVPIFRGLVKRKERFWVPTFHARNLAINDISEDMHFNDARRRLSGLENLHVLPLGQILLKAAIITGNQLESALAIQKNNGGYLGNILVDINAISEDTLATYLNIQQAIRRSAQDDREIPETLQLGQILLDAELIDEDQLSTALEHQKKQGGRIGEIIVEQRILSRDVLSIFLEVQDLIGMNYLDEDRARKLIHDMTHVEKTETDDLEILLLKSGLLSKHQLEAAKLHQETHHAELADTLLFLGYLTPENLQTINSVIHGDETQNLRKRS